MSLFLRKTASTTPARSRGEGEVCLHAGNPADFAAARCGFTPDPVQTAVLNDRSSRLLVCCARQWGKSTVAAVKALHFAVRNRQTTTLLASASLRQSVELLATVRRFAHTAGIEIQPLAPSGIFVPTTGSRILALPDNPNTVRGYAADLILIDEAAFTSAGLFDSLRPALAATQGSLWLLSSANSTSGYFYRTFQDRPEGWSIHTATAAQCPRFSAAFLENELRVSGDAVFRRDYHCQFLSGRHQFVSAGLFAAAHDPSLEHLEVGYAYRER